MAKFLQRHPQLHLSQVKRITQLQVPPTAPATSPVTGKKNYPTAAPVPGKEGFVFNPYTHNIVDVKGIASGKLCRDPEDTDQTHKFRVP